MTTGRFTTTLADQAVSSATNFGVALVLLLTTSVAEFGRFGFAVTLALIVLSVSRAVASEPFVLRVETHSAQRIDSDAAAFVAATLTGLLLLVVSWAAVGLSGAVVSVSIGAGILGLQDHRRYVAFANGQPSVALKSDALWFLTTMGLLAISQPLLFLSSRSMSPTIAALCWIAGAAVAHSGTASETAFGENAPFFKGSAVAWLRSTSTLGKSFLGELLLERASFQIGMIIAASYLAASDFGSLRVAHFVYGPVAILAGGLYTFLLSEFSRRTAGDQSTLTHRALAGSWLLVAATAPIWFVAPNVLADLVPWDSSSSARWSLIMAHLTYGGWVVGAIGRAMLRSAGALKLSAVIRSINGALFIVGVILALQAGQPLLGFLVAFATASILTAIVWTGAAIATSNRQTRESDLKTLATQNTTIPRDGIQVLGLTDQAPVTHVISGLKFFDNGALIGGHANALRGLVRAQTLHPDTHPDSVPSVLPLRATRASSEEFGGVVHSGGIATVLRMMRDRSQSQSGSVLHFHIGYLDYVILAQLCLRLARFKHVVVTHYCPAPLVHPHLAAKFRQRLIRAMSRGLEHIAISRNVQRGLAQLGINSDVISPAVDLRDFSYKGSERTVESASRFLFVGNLREEKNLVGCIRAFGEAASQHPNIRLVATIEDGDLASSDYGIRVADELSKWSVNDNVEFVGVVENMPALMAQCDAMILPFLGTRGPSDYFLAGLEGLAAGLPIICTDVGAMSEIVDDTCGRLVNPSNDAGLTKAICEFADGSLPTISPAKKAELVAMFHPDRIADQMNSVYQEMRSQ